MQLRYVTSNTYCKVKCNLLFFHSGHHTHSGETLWRSMFV